MQMVEAGRSIDVFRMPGRSRDTTVERLADLADDDHFVDRARLEAARKLRPMAPPGVGPECERIARIRPTASYAPSLPGEWIPVVAGDLPVLFNGTQFPYWNNIFGKRLAQNK